MDSPSFAAVTNRRHRYGGGDPTEITRARSERIGYLHLKDVDAAVLAGATRNQLGFLDALKQYIFCEFGEGLVDILSAINAPRDRGFAGWIIFASRRPAAESTAAGRRNLDDRSGL